MATLQTLRNDLGKNALTLLQSPQPAPIESILIDLLNEIAAFPENLSLVLDNYQAIHSRSIHEALLFFIEHIPSHMHLVITSRTDPSLPLARLRARGQLHEIRSELAPARAAGNLFTVMRSITNLARRQATQGRLRQAAATYQKVSEEAPGGLGGLLYEWNDLEAARGSMKVLSANAVPVSAPNYKRLLARHPFVAYFLFTYAGTWLIELPMVLSQDGAERLRLFHSLPACRANFPCAHHLG